MVEAITNDEPSKIRVLLADDHSMVLELITMLLSATSDISIVSAEDVDGALKLIAENGAYDLVLLDVDMPGMHGVDGLQRVAAANVGGYVGLITGDPTPQIVMAAKRAGAAGVISKKNSMRSLANTIRFMATGERYFPMDLIQAEDQPKPVAPSILSEREFQVLRQLADGLSNRDIANALSLAEPTVKMHVQSIYKKLNVNNRTQAVITARDLKLV